MQISRPGLVPFLEQGGGRGLALKDAPIPAGIVRRALNLPARLDLGAIETGFDERNPRSCFAYH